MMTKLKLWFLREFRGIDTSPKEFDMWFRRKLGEQLKSSGVYYALCYVGGPGVPTIGEDFKVFGELKEAQSEKERLQSGIRGATLEIRVIRVFYSEVK